MAERGKPGIIAPVVAAASNRDHSLAQAPGGQGVDEHPPTYNRADVLLHLRPERQPLSAVAASPATPGGVEERVLDLKKVLQPIAADMREVDGVIRARLDSDVVLINTVADYIIGAGGKRLRPAVLLLVARALGYAGSAHVLLAAVIEFIHTATLLHDDVVDESDLRRGRSTANSMFGNAASVLVGRLPLLAILPDDGRRREHARDADPGRRHEPHRRR